MLAIKLTVRISFQKSNTSTSTAFLSDASSQHGLNVDRRLLSPKTLAFGEVVKSFRFILSVNPP